MSYSPPRNDDVNLSGTRTYSPPSNDAVDLQDLLDNEIRAAPADRDTAVSAPDRGVRAVGAGLAEIDNSATALTRPRAAVSTAADLDAIAVAPSRERAVSGAVNDPANLRAVQAITRRPLSTATDVDAAAAEPFALRTVSAVSADEAAVSSDVVLVPFGPVFRNPATVRFDPRVERVEVTLTKLNR